MHKRVVCIITTVHPVHDIRIFYKQAGSLHRAGYSIKVIAQEGKVVKDEFEYFFLRKPRNRLERMIFYPITAYRKAKSFKADIYHLHDPELLTAGLFLKRKGFSVIYDAHEDLPKQIFDKPWVPKLLRGGLAYLVNKIEKHLSAKLDQVIAATPGIGESFHSNNINSEVIQNYPLLEEISNNQNAKEIDDIQNSFVYMGGISKERGVMEMVRAVGALPEGYRPELLLGGKIVPAGLEKDLEKISGWNRVDYLGWLDRDRVIELYRKSLAGLLIFQPSPNHENSQPNKMFEYMAAGLPVIASDFPFWKMIIEENKCGITVDPGDINAIAEAMIYLIENKDQAYAMGQRGRAAVIEKYNWTAEEKKLLALYNRVIVAG